MNLTRKMMRRKGFKTTPRERPYRLDPNGGGYFSLHPTNGWQRFSFKRVGVRQTVFPAEP